MNKKLNILFAVVIFLASAGVASAGVVPNGGTCTSNFDCLSNLCVNFRCTPAFYAQPNLPAGGIVSLWVVIFGVLSFIWPVFVGVSIIMLIIAGFFFLTAQGDASKLKDARNMVIWGVIGIIVAILAFSIPWIVATQLGQ